MLDILRHCILYGRDQSLMSNSKNTTEHSLLHVTAERTSTYPYPTVPVYYNLPENILYAMEHC